MSTKTGDIYARFNKAKQALIQAGFHVGFAWVDDERGVAYVASSEGVLHPSAEVTVTATGYHPTGGMQGKIDD